MIIGTFQVKSRDVYFYRFCIVGKIVGIDVKNSRKKSYNLKKRFLFFPCNQNCAKKNIVMFLITEMPYFELKNKIVKIHLAGLLKDLRFE